MSEQTAGTLAEQLAAFAIETLRTGAPTEVRTSVRQRVLDVLGLQAAALDLETSHAVREFVSEQGGAAQCQALGVIPRVPANWAAFANGVLAHSLDYDDTHLPSVVHPSASVVPAAMATAELIDVDNNRFLDAVAVGLETVVRLAMAGFDSDQQASIYFEHGQHATSICGAVGSAVASAVLMAADEGQIVDAIGISASMASGIIEANRTGGTVKRLHCGWAAHAGVTAAQLASKGITGPPTALEGRFGFFQAFLHGLGNLNEVDRALGAQWEVPGIFFKPYPANHFTHTGLDAARRLSERGLEASDCEEIVLRVPTATVRTIGEPIEVKRQPATGYQAQFSGPYMVALGFFGGGGLGASLEDFRPDLVQDPKRVSFMSKVKIEGDNECDQIFPYQFPSILTVRTKDGTEFEEKALVNRGGPDAPLSDEELVTKFNVNAAREWSEDVRAGLLEATMSPSENLRIWDVLPR